MGEIINKEYLTRDDLLAMRREIDTVLSMLRQANQRIDLLQSITENLNEFVIRNCKRLVEEDAKHYEA